VSQLSDNPQKVEGLAGKTFGAVIQTVSNIISGSVLGLVFIWRIGLVGTGKRLNVIVFSIINIIF